jgi:uncharacterized protein YprB with RNaseH-like and TPR domain
MENKVKTLILDIETSLMWVCTFRTGEQHIGIDQVMKDWHIMAWAAKWLDEKEVFYAETRNENDKPMLKKLWKLLDEADFVITQNGISFDMPRIDARMRLNRMKPYSPIKNWDTYRKNKSDGFTSHKLEYLTDKLNVRFKKLDHRDFPGRSLWIECDKGNPKAWASMKKYNIHDVLATEELYQNSKAWVKREIVNPETEVELHKCPTCNVKTRCYSNGLRVAQGKKYRRLTGVDCGHTFKGDISNGK